MNHSVMSPRSTKSSVETRRTSTDQTYLSAPLLSSRYNDRTAKLIQLPSGEEKNTRGVMQLMRRVLPCEDHRHNMTLYKRCFKGDEAVQAFREAFPQEIVSVEAAVAFGIMLQQKNILTHVTDPEKVFCAGRTLFRLQCYQTPEILNSARIYEEKIDGDAMDLLEEVSLLLLEVERAAANAQTSLVDYRVTHKSPYFSILEDALCGFQQVSLRTMDEITRIAVVINVYNIMIKFAYMKVGVPNNKSSRASFMSEVKINFGGDMLSFDELEFGVLCGNRKGIFGAKDSRSQLAVGNMDPRVYFVLHRTPKSPSGTILIRPNTLHYDLQREAKKYLSMHSNLMIDVTNGVIHLSELFRLNKQDFGNGEWMWLSQFLLRNLEGGKKLAMQAFIDSGRKPTIEYMNFDWRLDAGNFHAFKLSSIKVAESRLM